MAIPTQEDITVLQFFEKQLVYSDFSKQNSNISVLIINCCTFNKKIKLKIFYIPIHTFQVSKYKQSFVLLAITVVREAAACDTNRKWQMV